MDIDVDPRTINKFDNTTVTKNDVENEFWRLTQSPDDTVEMEDGADVHSTTHGSLVADGPLESQQHSRCVSVPPQVHQI